MNFSPDEYVLALGVAFAIDQFYGEYSNRWHPVVWIGWLIATTYGFLEKKTRKIQLIGGWILAFLIPSLVATLGFALSEGIGNPWISLAISIFLLKSTFALKALGKAHGDVATTIAMNRTNEAREQLASLCSRDSSQLSSSQIMASSLSSIAENLSDSFIAPVFYYTVFGLPGALFYRAINTADAMVGYRDHRLWLGQGAAKLDDLLNFIPARITAALLLLAGLLQNLPVGKAVQVTLRDHRKTPSPNGGWPMSALAGLFRIQLSKPNSYSLGDDINPIDQRTMKEAWFLVWLSGCFFMIAAILLRITDAT